MKNVRPALLGLVLVIVAAVSLFAATQTEDTPDTIPPGLVAQPPDVQDHVHDQLKALGYVN